MELLYFEPHLCMDFEVVSGGFAITDIAVWNIPVHILDLFCKYVHRVHSCWRRLWVRGDRAVDVSDIAQLSSKNIAATYAPTAPSLMRAPAFPHPHQRWALPTFTMLANLIGKKRLPLF